MMENLLKRYPVLEGIRSDIEQALELMISTYKNGGKVLVCGNGGSASDSDHIVGELLKGFILKRPVGKEFADKLKAYGIDNAEYLVENLQGSLPAIALPAQSGILSAFANDVEPDMVYAQLTYGYANEEDLVIGLSTSGNSKNVVNAIKIAKAKGAKTLAMTGEKESELSKLSDVTIRVPESETYKIQELHLPVYHYLCAETEKEFFE